MRVRAFVPDLMDASRLRAQGVSVDFVSEPARLLDGEAELFVVDLARPGALEAICGGSANPGRIVGFAPHGDREAIAAALEAGCDQALVRSVFFRRFPDLGDDT
ncbi:MAG: hypothetical protein H8E59_10380 [Actinobacteria bacterium]|nr:hypothetical protein [Actinomycetota bacterium]